MTNHYLWIAVGILIVLWLFTRPKKEKFDQKDDRDKVINKFGRKFHQHQLAPDDQIKTLINRDIVDHPGRHLNQRTDGEFPEHYLGSKPVIVPSKYHPSQVIETRDPMNTGRFGGAIESHRAHLTNNFPSPYELESVVFDPPLLQSEIKAYGKLASEDDWPRGKWRPFNDFNQRLSYTELAESQDVDQSFDNSYYQLYGTEQEHGLRRKMAKIKKMKEKGVDTYPFKKVNQCMTRCSRDKDCYGIDVGDDKCTLIRQPPFAYQRHSYNEEINNYPYDVYKKFNRIRKPYGNIFYYYGDDHGHDAYGSEYSPKKCLEMCPKCQIGKCPDHYRCVNVRTDPKNGIGCVITNRRSYDEDKGQTYDGPEIEAIKPNQAIDMGARYRLHPEGGIKFDQPNITDPRRKYQQAS